MLQYKTDQQLEELHWKTAWYFDGKFKKQAASYDVFKHAVTYVSSWSVGRLIDWFDAVLIHSNMDDWLIDSFTQSVTFPNVIWLIDCLICWVEYVKYFCSCSHRSIDWLTNDGTLRLVGRLIDWLIGWLIGWFFSAAFLWSTLMFYSDPSILDECNLDEKTKEVLVSNIRRRLTPQAVKIRAGNHENFRWVFLWRGGGG